MRYFDTRQKATVREGMFQFPDWQSGTNNLGGGGEEPTSSFDHDKTILLSY